MNLVCRPLHLPGAADLLRAFQRSGESPPLSRCFFVEISHLYFVNNLLY